MKSKTENGTKFLWCPSCCEWWDSAEWEPSSLTVEHLCDRCTRAFGMPECRPIFKPGTGVNIQCAGFTDEDPTLAESEIDEEAI